MILFKIYSNDHRRELCLESGGKCFTSVVHTATVNLIRPGCGGRSSKHLQSSGITIHNSVKTSNPPGGDRSNLYLNSVDLYIVEDDACTESE